MNARADITAAGPAALGFFDVKGVTDAGNHFAAWQEPDLFTNEVRAALRSLREGSSS